jgi:hypothetical protein
MAAQLVASRAVLSSTELVIVKYCIPLEFPYGKEGRYQRDVTSARSHLLQASPCHNSVTWCCQIMHFIATPKRAHHSQPNLRSETPVPSATVQHFRVLSLR